MPTPTGIPAILPAEFFGTWAQHLRSCGFVHVDEVAALAVDGVVDVEKLPKQRIKLAPPMRGPRHNFNNATQWVPVDQPDPEPMRLPDITTLTVQENEAMLAQYRAAGMIPAPTTQPVGAVDHLEEGLR